MEINDIISNWSVIGENSVFHSLSYGDSKWMNWLCYEQEQFFNLFVSKNTQNQGFKMIHLSREVIQKRKVDTKVVEDE